MIGFKGKRVLVAGGTGLIGIPLVELLIAEGAEVRIASLDDPSRAHGKAEFQRVDLTIFDNCMACCRGMDYVFNLLCVKGSPAVAKIKPASFLVPHLMFNTSLMEAARRSGVAGFLFASSLAVYPPASVFREDDVWKGLPSDNDRFAGWAKRMGELQAEAFRIEYGWNNIAVVRPANVYGPHDNFQLENAMVVPSLIRRAVNGDNPLVVWGDGTQERDFIHAKDVALGMLAVAKSGESRPVNLGTGVGLPLTRLVEIIVDNLDVKPRIEWDTSKAIGDRRRILDTSRSEALGFRPTISIEQGIRETIAWYKQNASGSNRRYDIFAAHSAEKQ